MQTRNISTTELTKNPLTCVFKILILLDFFDPDELVIIVKSQKCIT